MLEQSASQIAGYLKLTSAMLAVNRPDVASLLCDFRSALAFEMSTATHVQAIALTKLLIYPRL